MKVCPRASISFKSACHAATCLTFHKQILESTFRKCTCCRWFGRAVNNSISYLSQMLHCRHNSTEVRACQDHFGRMYAFPGMYILLFGPQFTLWRCFPGICIFRCLRCSSKHSHMVRISKLGMKQGHLLPHMLTCNRHVPSRRGQNCTWFS